MAMNKKPGSSPRGTRNVKSEKGIKPKKIDYSDIPELSDRQLSAMRRAIRPTVSDEPRKLVAIHLDAKVLRWLRKTVLPIKFLATTIRSCQPVQKPAVVSSLVDIHHTWGQLELSPNHHKIRRAPKSPHFQLFKSLRENLLREP